MGKRRSIQNEDLFLEIIMIFGEKLQSAPNFKYPPLIGVAQNFIFQTGVTQNFIFQNWVTKQKSLRNPGIAYQKMPQIFMLFLFLFLSFFIFIHKIYFYFNLPIPAPLEKTNLTILFPPSALAAVFLPCVLHRFF